MTSAWQQLERVQGLRAVMASWRDCLGEDVFGLVKPHFLSRTEVEAKTYPSPHVCGCPMRVVKHAEKDIVGVSECGSAGCRDVRLQKADIVMWEFDRQKLGRAIAWAFECEAGELRTLVPSTVQIGVWERGGVSVLLTLPQSRDEFQRVITELVARDHRRFILFGLSNRFVDERSKTLLARVGAEYFALSTHALLEADGRLAANTPPEILFANFLPTAGRAATARPIAARYVFAKSGMVWRVSFDGSAEFHLEDTLGAKYLEYLLHHPNKAIRAFDLEREIQPEKNEVREETSIQPAVDAQARREVREELAELAEELEEAEAEGQSAKVKRIRGEIAKLESVVRNESVLGGDTGERARDNVRKAINKVIAKLRKGGKEEQAFGVHVGRFVSLGYDVIYNQPENMNWS